jgi:hypothetical protein
VLADAKKRGVHTGRKHTLRPHQRAEAVRLHLEEGESLGKIAALFGCGRTVVYCAIHGGDAAPLARQPGEAGMSGSFPLLQAARLWQRTRSRGTRYMSGRLGGVKVVIMPNRDFAGMTRPTAIRTSCSSRTVRQRHRRHATAERTPAEKRDPRPRQAPRGGPIDDDPVPF